jgi:predicted AAA+ superfamily ATPase
LAYSPRIVDEELVASLGALGAVVIEGPRATGKTATAREQAASEVLLDVDPGARAAVDVDPALILDGSVPRLIDEWQVAPEIWNHVRRAVDDRRAPGQFILTGSAVPADDDTRHTGAGRIGRLRMRPMSLFESGHSSGEVSLADLLNGDTARSSDTGATVAGLTERICVGGWPGFQRLALREGLVAVGSYLDEIRRADVSRVDSTRRDPARVGRLLRSLARNVATTAAITTIAADTEGTDPSLSRDSVYDYLSALERLMIVENQPAWGPHLRSRAQVRVAAKRHFVDPSLAVAALAASPERLLRDLNYLGLLFESLVVRDLRVYAQASDGVVTHYRDSDDLEVDAIVETRAGRWAAFEIKLGGAKALDAAAASLLKFSQRVDTEKVGRPACVGVVVATGFGYERPDGVAVIPISSLKH